MGNEGGGNLIFLISNLDIFKGAEPISGEKKSNELRDRGDCPRVKVSQGPIIAVLF